VLLQGMVSQLTNQKSIIICTKIEYVAQGCTCTAQGKSHHAVIYSRRDSNPQSPPEEE
jgi:hypothetical protein